MTPASGPPHAHVVGAGLAGLSAAVRLTHAGWRVTLSEAAPQSGGRCRSWHDDTLGLTIDNGNHLLLSGNADAHDYLQLTGGLAALIGPSQALFPWLDRHTGQRWTLHPNAGRLPWWLLDRHRRVPGTAPADYTPLARLMAARPDATVADTIATTGPLWDRLLEPFLISALNTPAAEGSAKLAGAVIRGSLARGGAASLPRVAHPTLAAAFVTPALAWLGARGAAVHHGRRLRALTPGTPHTLHFAGGDETAPTIVLALPAGVTAELVPGLTVPDRHHAILNAHFAQTPPRGAELLTGVVGGTAEWVFALPDRISTTTSAADRLLGHDRAALAALLWADAAAALRLPAATPMPPHRIVAEKRATFAATPAQDARRPAARTAHAGLYLAGDWTQTGLPATIEGAIRSGVTAATLARRAGLA